MQAADLNKGMKMLLLAFGVSQMPHPIECENSVFEVIQAGCRLIDTHTNLLPHKPLNYE
jgi:2,5-diketo-D-gluconate reductase A